MLFVSLWSGAYLWLLHDKCNYDELMRGYLFCALSLPSSLWLAKMDHVGKSSNLVVSMCQTIKIQWRKLFFFISLPGGRCMNEVQRVNFRQALFNEWKHSFGSPEYWPFDLFLAIVYGFCSEKFSLRKWLAINSGI